MRSHFDLLGDLSKQHHRRCWITGSTPPYQFSMQRTTPPGGQILREMLLGKVETNEVEADEVETDKFATETAGLTVCGDLPPGAFSSADMHLRCAREGSFDLRVCRGGIDPRR